MILSPKEKDIIKYIVKGKITDLLEYINVMFEFKRIQLSELTLLPMGSIPAGTIFVIVNDDKSLNRDIIAFGTLIKKLEKRRSYSNRRLGL